MSHRLLDWALYLGYANPREHGFVVKMERHQHISLCVSISETRLEDSVY